MVVGYRDPAREGTNLSFSCLSGTMLAGPNVSTCTEEGQWEPDPREVVCKGEIINIYNINVMTKAGSHHSFMYVAT